MNPIKVSQNFKLTMEARQKLDGYAKLIGMNKTAIIEQLIMQPQWMAERLAEFAPAEKPVGQSGKLDDLIKDSDRPIVTPKSKPAAKPKNDPAPKVSQKPKTRVIRDPKLAIAHLSYDDADLKRRLILFSNDVGMKDWKALEHVPSAFVVVCETIFEFAVLKKDQRFLEAAWKHVPEVLEFSGLQAPCAEPETDESAVETGSPAGKDTDGRPCSPLLPLDDEKISRIKKAAVQAGFGESVDEFTEGTRFDALVDTLHGAAVDGDDEAREAIKDYLPEVEV